MALLNHGYQKYVAKHHRDLTPCSFFTSMWSLMSHTSGITRVHTYAIVIVHNSVPKTQLGDIWGTIPIKSRYNCDKPNCIPGSFLQSSCDNDKSHFFPDWIHFFLVKPKSLLFQAQGLNHHLHWCTYHLHPVSFRWVQFKPIYWLTYESPKLAKLMINRALFWVSYNISPRISVLHHDSRVTTSRTVRSPRWLSMIYGVVHLQLRSSLWLWLTSPWFVDGPNRNRWFTYVYLAIKWWIFPWQTLSHNQGV